MLMLRIFLMFIMALSCAAFAHPDKKAKSPHYTDYGHSLHLTNQYLTKHKPPCRQGKRRFIRTKTLHGRTVSSSSSQVTMIPFKPEEESGETRSSNKGYTIQIWQDGRTISSSSQVTRIPFQHEKESGETTGFIRSDDYDDDFPELKRSVDSGEHVKQVMSQPEKTVWPNLF